MIYIASPYSSPIVGAQQLRFEKVRRFTIHLFNQGLVPFSPIVYSHEMAAAGGLRTDVLSWFRFNTDMLRRSDAIFVFCLPGWETSKGVKIEVNQATLLQMETHYFDEDFNQLVAPEEA